MKALPLVVAVVLQVKAERSASTCRATQPTLTMTDY
jgi:hypothetical protein